MTITQEQIDAMKVDCEKVGADDFATLPAGQVLELIKDRERLLKQAVLVKRQLDALNQDAGNTSMMPTSVVDARLKKIDSILGHSTPLPPQEDTDMTNHIKTPVKIDDELGDEALYLVDADGVAIAEVCDDDGFGHQNEIAEAVNSHTQQKERIEELERALTDIAVYGCGMLNQPIAINGPEEEWLRKRIAQYERVARAALSKITQQG